MEELNGLTVTFVAKLYSTVGCCGSTRASSWSRNLRPSLRSSMMSDPPPREELA